MALELNNGGAKGFIARFRAAAADALVRETAEEAGAIRKAVSKPVERLPGGHVIRSRPGEPPRLDTGELHANIDAQVFEQKDGALAVVSSAKPKKPHVPNALEREMNRPYMVPSYMRFQTTGIDNVIRDLTDVK